MADQQDQQGVPVQINEEGIPPQVVQQQNIQVLSIKNISSIIKEAVGGVKYILTTHCLPKIQRFWKIQKCS